MPKDEKVDSLTVELNAVKIIVSALKPLEAEARERVLASSMNLLGGGYLPRSTRALVATPEPESLGAPGVDIRSLKEQKQPKSVIEMVALVAYYLSEMASPAERRNYISAADVDKYFKQAGHPMPASASMALVHSKNAGYLDQLGEGRYRLNPVGYNLVAHSLPRTAKAEPAARRRNASKRKPRATKNR
jgi:hypothetical protein